MAESKEKITGCAFIAVWAFLIAMCLIFWFGLYSLVDLFL